MKVKKMMTVPMKKTEALHTDEQVADLANDINKPNCLL